MPIPLRADRAFRQAALIVLMCAALVSGTYLDGGGPFEVLGRGTYWSALFAIAFGCAAFALLLAFRLFSKGFNGSTEGLYLRDGRLVFLEPWVWSQKIDEIDDVGLIVRKTALGSSLPSLEFAMKDGRRRYVPIGLLMGNGASIRDSVKAAIQPRTTG